MDATAPRTWRIGELAAASGLSVRALRHYDELGLLTPAERSESGYRLYSAAEVRRLYRITALRRLGLGLEARRSGPSGSRRPSAPGPRCSTNCAHTWRRAPTPPTRHSTRSAAARAS